SRLQTAGGILRDDAGRRDGNASAVRLFGVGLDDVERLHPFDELEMLLAESLDGARDENLPSLGDEFSCRKIGMDRQMTFDLRRVKRRRAAGAGELRIAAGLRFGGGRGRSFRPRLGEGELPAAAKSGNQRDGSNNLE